LEPAARAGFGRLSHAAARRDPQALIAAFKELGYVSTDDSPMAYMGLGRNMAGMGGDGDVERVNARLARALRGFRLARVPAGARALRGFNMAAVRGGALLVMRVLGLLAGLSARLGRSGPVLAAWSTYAEPLAATGS